MDYTKKHKDLIAKLFKKVGMLKEAKIVLSCDEYKCDIGKAMRGMPLAKRKPALERILRY